MHGPLNVKFKYSLHFSSKAYLSPNSRSIIYKNNNNNIWAFSSLEALY